MILILWFIARILLYYSLWDLLTFLYYRTSEEIEIARSTPLAELPDKQTDEER